MSPPRLTGPLAAILKQDRERFNARFAQAALYNARLRAGELNDHLLEVVDPLVRSVSEIAPDRLVTVADVLFDVSLDGLGRDLFGRHPAVRHAWTKLLPLVPELLAEEPQKLITAVSNAAYNLSVERPEAAERWLSAMVEIASACRNSDEFLSAGQILAWRCGLAHYRESALTVWQRLPPDLAARLLPYAGSNQDLPAVATQIGHPWFMASAEASEHPRLVMEVGAFLGFGGQFVGTPQVASDGSQLFATDKQTWWTLHADRFGSTLKRFGRGQPEGLIKQKDRFILGRKRQFSWKRIAPEFPGLCHANSLASDGETLAVTLPHSYRIFLLAIGVSDEHQ